MFIKRALSMSSTLPWGILWTSWALLHGVDEDNG